VPGKLVGLHVPQHGADLVDQRHPDGVLRRRQLDQPAAGLVAGRQRLGEEVAEQEDLHPTLAHPGHELVVLVLGALDPQHVVEQQLVVVGRGQPLEAELGPVHHHLAQPTDLRVDAEALHHPSDPIATALTGRPPGVPASPSTIASISPRPPMAARLPVASTNRIAASTLGPTALGAKPEVG
jgi:hypothetical protein